MLGEILVMGQAMVFALMNVVDAHIVKKQVSHIFSFIPVSGLGNLLIAIPFLLWFWDPYHVGSWFAIGAGILFGVQAILYYLVIESEDASHMIGIIYMYPLFGLIIGSWFLNETLTPLNYLGCAITLIGVALTTQRTLGKWKVLVPLTIIALTVAVQEALQSVAVETINFWFASGLQTFFMGLTLLLMLFWNRPRKHFKSELKNLKFAFLSEGLTMLAVVLLVAGLMYIPYIVASFISVSQILFVVIIEKLWSYWHPQIMRDQQTMKKTIALIVITIGVILVIL